MSKLHVQFDCQNVCNEEEHYLVLLIAGFSIFRGRGNKNSIHPLIVNCDRFYVSRVMLIGLKLHNPSLKVLISTTNISSCLFVIDNTYLSQMMFNFGIFNNVAPGVTLTVYLSSLMVFYICV